jgi:hypothetical protein
MTDSTKIDPPNTASATPRAPTLGPTNARWFGILGTLGGMLVGYLVGRAGGGASDVRATDPAAISSAATTASSAAPPPSSNPSIPAGPAELALSLTAPGAERAVRAGWTKGEVLGRAVIQAAGPSATLAVTLRPGPGSYGLGVIGVASGLPPDGALDVGVRVNDKDAGRWRMEATFQMQSLTLDARALSAGENTIEFSLPPSAGGSGPSLALESIHVTPLVSRAEVTLAQLGAQGGLVSGFYGREGEGAEASTWSAGLRTQVGLLMGPLSTEYDLELDGLAFGPLQPLDVEAVVNGKKVGRARVDRGPSYVFHAPPGAFKTGLNLVEFVYPKTGKPSVAIKGSHDTRDLAIRILRVSATPAATPLQ